MCRWRNLGCLYRTGSRNEISPIRRYVGLVDGRDCCKMQGIRWERWYGTPGASKRGIGAWTPCLMGSALTVHVTKSWFVDFAVVEMARTGLIHC